MLISIVYTSKHQASENPSPTTVTYDFEIHEHGQQENETKTKLEVTKKHKTHVLTTHSQYPIT